MLGQGGKVAAQEGIGGVFQMEGDRQGWQSRIPQQAGIPKPLLELRVFGFGLYCKLQIGDGVFVCGVSLGFLRQRAQPAQGIEKLLDGAVENPSAPCGKQCVSTKQRWMGVIGQVSAEIGEMILGMPGGGQHPGVQVDFGNIDGITMADSFIHAKGLAAGWSDDARLWPSRLERRDAIDVVMMMVRDQDSRQGRASAAEFIKHGLGLARIHHDNDRVRADAPYIVIFQRWNGADGIAAVGRIGDLADFSDHRSSKWALNEWKRMDKPDGAMPPLPGTQDHKANPNSWSQWLRTPQGQSLLAWERKQLAHTVDNFFGYHAIQLGMPSLDALLTNRMPHRIHVLAGRERAQTDDDAWQPDLRVADYGELPLASQSIDLVVLPHQLECSLDPHQLLREVDRVLRPEGHLVILGINPWSLWGARQVMPCWLAPAFLPRTGLISAPRMRDWIRLLGFEPADTVYGIYTWPFQRQPWLIRSQRLLEYAGDRLWPVCGALYLISAVKRVRSMRLIGPAWRRATGPAGTAVALGGQGPSCSIPDAADHKTQWSWMRLKWAVRQQE